MAINAPNPASTCLYSTVRNLLSREAYFGFLPPGSRRLAAGEEISVWGDVQHHLTKLTPNERSRRSLERALTDLGDGASLALVSSPGVHLFDLTTDETKILTLDNGSFAAADPCWGSFSLSASETCNAPSECYEVSGSGDPEANAIYVRQDRVLEPWIRDGDVRDVPPFYELVFTTDDDTGEKFYEIFLDAGDVLYESDTFDGVQNIECVGKGPDELSWSTVTGPGPAPSVEAVTCP